jgi:formyl-CoA transferase
VPVRVGVSIGDSLASLHGVIGVLMALYHRKVNGGRGQYIDIGLYEAVFNLMESLLPEYDAFGVVRERTGSALPGIAPTNAYPCRDGQYVLVAGNGDSIFRRLMGAIGRPDLASDPALASNEGRVKRVEELDRAIGEWTAGRSIDQVLEAMTAARVPAGRIYSAKDIAEDPHYAARGMIAEVVSRDGLRVKTPGVVPKLSETPGSIRTTAPRLGEDTEAVLGRLGYTTEQIAALRAEKVI